MSNTARRWRKQVIVNPLLAGYNTPQTDRTTEAICVSVCDTQTFTTFIKQHYSGQGPNYEYYVFYRSSSCISYFIRVGNLNSALFFFKVNQFKTNVKAWTESHYLIWSIQNAYKFSTDHLFNCETHPGKSLCTGLREVRAVKTLQALSCTQPSGDGRKEARWSASWSKENKLNKTLFLLLLLQSHHICFYSHSAL